MSEMPVEPRFSKMVLYAVALKCLDPVLTIACCLSCKVGHRLLNLRMLEPLLGAL